MKYYRNTSLSAKLADTIAFGFCLGVIISFCSWYVYSLDQAIEKREQRYLNQLDYQGYTGPLPKPVVRGNSGPDFYVPGFYTFEMGV